MSASTESPFVSTTISKYFGSSHEIKQFDITLYMRMLIGIT